MAKAQNKVIAGDYKGGAVKVSLGRLYISAPFKLTPVYLDSKNVENIELMGDEHRKSTASAIKRGIVGAVIAGPAGAVIGGVTGKSKGIYQVAVYFNDGKKSLLELDDKLYKLLLKDSF